MTKGDSRGGRLFVQLVVDEFALHVGEAAIVERLSADVFERIAAAEERRDGTNISVIHARSIGHGVGGALPLLCRPDVTDPEWIEPKPGLVREAYPARGPHLKFLG